MGWKPFEKGNTFHEMRAKLSNELRHVQNFTPIELRKIISLMLQKNEAELDAICQGGLTPAKHLIFARVLLDIMRTKTFGKDDIAKLEFLLDRTVGKVKEEVLPANQYRALPTQELLVLAEQQIRELKGANADSVQVEDVAEPVGGHIPTSDAGQADGAQTDPERDRQP